MFPSSFSSMRFDIAREEGDERAEMTLHIDNPTAGTR
jgi:hypothetical protein